jgi:hypothetical protein
VAKLPQNLQIVIPVTDGLGQFWQPPNHQGELVMKKIALVFALAFALTTGMAVMTVVAHTGQAMADGNGCGSSNC